MPHDAPRSVGQALEELREAIRAEGFICPEGLGGAELYRLHWLAMVAKSAMEGRPLKSRCFGDYKADSQVCSGEAAPHPCCLLRACRIMTEMQQRYSAAERP